jgi:hypothetical protein
LINVGWFEANNLKCDYMAMHDVDIGYPVSVVFPFSILFYIVPINSELNYQYPGDGKVVHIASGKYHPIERFIS